MPDGILVAGEADPVIVVNGQGRCRVVLVCEHAGRVIPRSMGNLGLSAADLERHIAWDIGAEGLARKLSASLDAPLVLQRYSRLVYDCNRPPEHAGAMPEVSELTLIPANQNLTPSARQARAQALYHPFHAAVRAVVDAKLAEGQQPVIVTLHSFTRVFKGVTRAVELGLLHHSHDRLARQLLQLMQARHPGIDTRLNEPYGPEDGVAHTLDLQANARGLANVMIEIRNDLIADDKGQAAWAGLLAPLLEQALGETTTARNATSTVKGDSHE